MSITASAGIFEVDLVFPSNATYSPRALQNPSLITPSTAFLTWSPWKGKNKSYPGSVNSGIFELSVMDISSNVHFLVSEFVNTIAYPDGYWTLEWIMSINNCSQPEGYYHDINEVIPPSLPSVSQARNPIWWQRILSINVAR
ncbi:hypothetical protein N7540_004595 [Penicillium herquei]|nr:hypothetical protein N7540_004595 [Penicillium herquei]